MFWTGFLDLIRNSWFAVTMSLSCLPAKHTDHTRLCLLIDWTWQPGQQAYISVSLSRGLSVLIPVAPCGTVGSLRTDFLRVWGSEYVQC